LIDVIFKTTLSTTTTTTKAKQVARTEEVRREGETFVGKY
jgi:hypothetical protein